jgi:Tfp pilus assembly protein PilX
MNLSTISRGRQRGAAALAASMLLLFASSIVVFYLNRGLIFEQKTSANQLRSTAAFEVAEAGIEWATGMLNRPYDIDANCNLLATANVSFLRRYIQTGYPSNTGVQVTTNTFPGCKVNGTTLTCGCPVPSGSEQVANPGAALQSSFTVAFSPVNDPATGTQDPTAVRVTSTGCTPQAGICKPLTAGSAATTGASDANATVSVILKLNPTLRAAPSAALTCGTSCFVGGAYTVKNEEVLSNGYLVNAGTTIDQSPYALSHYQTIPGQPVQNALIPADTSLSSLAAGGCSNSAMFSAYFGATLAQYAASPEVKTLAGCDNPATCRTLVTNAYNEGWRSFWFPDGMDLNNAAGGPWTLGAPAAGQGVNLVSDQGININGNITINGLLFSNSTNTNDLGTGSANVNGAMIACSSYSNNGSGTLSYNSAALGGTGLRPGLMVRVPGSWRDQATAY